MSSKNRLEIENSRLRVNKNRKGDQERQASSRGVLRQVAVSFWSETLKNDSTAKGKWRIEIENLSIRNKDTSLVEIESETGHFGRGVIIRQKDVAIILI